MLVLVTYCVYYMPRSSLLIESTDYMIIFKDQPGYHWNIKKLIGHTQLTCH